MNNVFQFVTMDSSIIMGPASPVHRTVMFVLHPRLALHVNPTMSRIAIICVLKVVQMGSLMMEVGCVYPAHKTAMLVLHQRPELHVRLAIS